MKGQVLVNCGAMGLDSASLSLSGYLEALAVHNAAPDSDAKGEVMASDGLRRFAAAHGALGG